jgi:AcrR family transcriptional regulator
MDRDGGGTDDEGSLRAVRLWPKRAVHRALLDAVLECAGDRGYAEMTLSEVLARAGVNNRTFHRYFGSLADCFAEAYELAAEDLAEELLAAGRREETWQAGYRATIATFLAFVRNRSKLARVLVVEHRVADGRAAAQHAKVMGRLARALDRGRHEPAAAERMPSLTSRLVLGMVEFAVGELIVSGRAQDSDELASSLTYVGVLLYCGRQAAEAEI